MVDELAACERRVQALLGSQQVAACSSEGSKLSKFSLTSLTFFFSYGVLTRIHVFPMCVSPLFLRERKGRGDG